MLREPAPPLWSGADQEVFACLVPPDHYLRRALESIDFERLRPLAAVHYSPDQGRPAEDPVLMLKLAFLQYHDNLSDRQVIARAQTDVAYRYFLGVPLKEELPDPSSLCVFRGRLGVEGHREVFHAVVAQASKRYFHPVSCALRSRRMCRLPASGAVHGEVACDHGKDRDQERVRGAIRAEGP